MSSIVESEDRANIFCRNCYIHRQDSLEQKDQIGTNNCWVWLLLEWQMYRVLYGWNQCQNLYSWCLFCLCNLITIIDDRTCNQQMKTQLGIIVHQWIVAHLFHPIFEKTIGEAHLSGSKLCEQLIIVESRNWNNNITDDSFDHHKSYPTVQHICSG